MSPKFNKLFNFVFLLIFLSLTLFINFFHTGKNILENCDCPACHFQSSTLATNLMIYLYLPQFMLLERLITFESFQYNQPHLIIPLSRAPPQA